MKTTSSYCCTLSSTLWFVTFSMVASSLRRSSTGWRTCYGPGPLTTVDIMVGRHRSYSPPHIQGIAESLQHRRPPPRTAIPQDAPMSTQDVLTVGASTAQHGTPVMGTSTTDTPRTYPLSPTPQPVNSSPGEPLWCSATTSGPWHTGLRWMRYGCRRWDPLDPDVNDDILTLLGPPSAGDSTEPDENLLLALEPPPEFA